MGPHFVDVVAALRVPGVVPALERGADGAVHVVVGPPTRAGRRRRQSVHQKQPNVGLNLENVEEEDQDHHERHAQKVRNERLAIKSRCREILLLGRMTQRVSVKESEHGWESAHPLHLGRRRSVPPASLVSHAKTRFRRRLHPSSRRPAAKSFVMS